jgi:hypothetical protein
MHQRVSRATGSLANGVSRMATIINILLEYPGPDGTQR